MMTIQAQFIPRNYDVFAFLNVDKKSMAVIFTDHQQLMHSLRLPYSAAQLLNYVSKYVSKHFAEQRVAFVYEAGPTASACFSSHPIGPSPQRKRMSA